MTCVTQLTFTGLRAILFYQGRQVVVYLLPSTQEALHLNASKADVDTVPAIMTLRAILLYLGKKSCTYNQEIKKPAFSSDVQNWGMSYKTLLICKVQILYCGQILTESFFINRKNYVTCMQPSGLKLKPQVYCTNNDHSNLIDRLRLYRTRLVVMGRHLVVTFTLAEIFSVSLIKYYYT